MAASIEKVLFPAKKKVKKRVCAYARVSVNDADMWHSLWNQINIYTKTISDNPKWEFAGVFWDNPTTGTKGDRPKFQEMLQKCRNGEIDMIIVKSISRFARNTVLLISLVRELKTLGVDVFFENQNIHTLSAQGEFMLTLFGAIAQAESLSVSENCKWRIQNKFKEGIMTPCRTLGYDFKDNQLVINKKEAKIVKEAFRLYLEGVGSQVIANQFNKLGYTTKNGKAFTAYGIRLILTNEKYTGDILLQKWYTVDHISKRTTMNDGVLDSYYVEDHHPAIISKDEFNKVQDLLSDRAEKYCNNEKITLYPFSFKVICGECGMHYGRKITHGIPKLVCHTYNTRGKAFCQSKQVPEQTMKTVAAKVLGLAEFDEIVFNDRVDYIEVFNGNRLDFHLKNGAVITEFWKDRSRAESWTPEMKEKARLKSLGKCSNY